MKVLLERVVALFGTRSERLLVPYRARVQAINGMEAGLRELADDDLRRRFTDLRQRHENGAALRELQTETFAIVREAAWRVLAMRHFDVQLLGGMVLYDGNIAEMKTGEGKTLAATLPVCLEALSGNGVHVVTVNDYLAGRDSEWMGALYRFLQLSVGANSSNLSVDEKTAVYRGDIIYGTNNEFGFDYLRHNMRYTPEGVQRPLNFAIVDEVDSILIDEARTPLIISGESNENVDLYQKIADIAKHFKQSKGEDDGGDFTLDEKARSVQMNEEGFERAEELFAEADLMKSGDSLYASDNLPLLHHLDVALRARYLFLRDRDYVVQNGQVVIVDEFTGRLMPGRRWGDNQHQAVEAKEQVTVQKESQTLASISFQNYFRLYNKLAGMTGTAQTEAEEFEFIYGLQTIAVPTHQQMVREDELDKIYRSTEAKNRAVLADIVDSVARGQPVLVGTTAIADSERLSERLKENGLAHNVLNAKEHENEASIIAQAGAPLAITIATNMAGRGTDIILGGNPQAQRDAIERDDSLSADVRQQKIAAVDDAWQQQHDQTIAAGGLRIIGTERHESRRIDNQLRGRSGRQGDPGSSIFYLSFEDSLLRIFATKHVASLMEKLRIDEDEAIEANMVSRTIANAQRKVETHNFDIRKQLLEYDDIANEQRRIVYEQREEILQADDIGEVAGHFRLEHLDSLFDEYLPADVPEEEWRAAELQQLLARDYRIQAEVGEWVVHEDNQRRGYFLQRMKETAEAQFAAKWADIDANHINQFMRSLILNIIDDHWRSHIAALDSLRLSIGFRGMAQKNPKQEYKRESFEMFETLLATIRMSVAKVLYALAIKREEETPQPQPPPSTLQYRHESAAALTAETQSNGAAAGGEEPVAAHGGTVRRHSPKVRRNDPCPCGSGKKYKQCCGRI